MFADLLCVGHGVKKAGKGENGQARNFQQKAESERINTTESPGAHRMSDEAQWRCMASVQEKMNQVDGRGKAPMDKFLDDQDLHQRLWSDVGSSDSRGGGQG